MKDKDYLFKILKQNKGVCGSLIFIILLGILLIVTTIILQIHKMNNMKKTNIFLVPWIILMIITIINWMLVLILNIIFNLNNFKIKNYFKKDDTFWIIMSVLIFFFTLTIASISLNKINQYIKYLKLNHVDEAKENIRFI